jgi:hypothetical protein
MHKLLALGGGEYPHGLFTDIVAHFGGMADEPVAGCDLSDDDGMPLRAEDRASLLEGGVLLLDQYRRAVARAEESVGTEQGISLGSDLMLSPVSQHAKTAGLPSAVGVGSAPPPPRNSDLLSRTRARAIAIGPNPISVLRSCPGRRSHS